MKTRDLAVGESEFRRQRQRRGRNRDDPGREPEHDAFDDEALRERHSAGTERQGDRDLVASTLGAQQKEVDDVRRRDEKNDGDEHAEENELRPHRRDGRGLERLDRDARAAALQQLRCDLREARRERRDERIQLRLRLAHGDAVAQTSDDGEAPRRDLLVLEIQRRGIPDGDRRCREVEGAREDADDHARAVVDVDATSDDRRVGAVASLPELLRDEDREQLAIDAADPRRILALEERAEERAHAEERRTCSASSWRRSRAPARHDR